jgi:hypothetical protein
MPPPPHPPPSSIDLSSNVGLTNLNPALCPNGSFKLSLTGCFQCGPGRYGDRTNLTSPACSGPCTAGLFCPAGTISPTLECARGKYSATGAAACTSCPLGLTTSVARLTNITNCTVAYVPVSAPERQGLVNLYAALNGPGWSVGEGGWHDFADLDVDPCQPSPWLGLTCNVSSILYVRCIELFWRVSSAQYLGWRARELELPLGVPIRGD